MPNSSETTVLLIDDDEAVARLVGTILEQNDYAPSFATNGLQALEVAEQLRPEIIVLDLGLPGLGGMEVCTKLRSWYQGPILVLSGTGDEETIVEALDRGADDFLAKPFRANELLARLRALMRRAQQLLIRDNEIVVGDLTVNFAKRRVYRGDVETRLTRTEFDILGVLVRNLDIVVTSEIILEQVWGRHHGEYAQTLRVHVGHIRRKIELDSGNPDYLITEPGVGYRFTIPESLGGDDADAAGTT